MPDLYPSNARDWLGERTQQWLPFVDLGCAFASGAIWYGWPQAGGWPLLVALLPWFIRLVAGLPLYRPTLFDLPLAIFLFTAAVGVWASYDRTAGWAKFWVLCGAVFLFYALAGQPRKNLWPVAGLFSLLGAVLSTFFILSYDFHQQPADLDVIERLTSWWMANRPVFWQSTVSPNVVGGILAGLAPLSFALAIYTRWSMRLPARMAAASAAAWISIGLLLTSSRGAWLALVVALGFWVLFRVIHVRRERVKQSPSVLFFAAALVGIIPFLMLAALPSGLIELANLLPGLPSGGSRVDLARNTLALIRDFPFTGGGLGAFPGLYSHYIMVIPVFLFGYSHNLFLDVALEQGILGLLSFGIILFGSLWLLLARSRSIPGQREDRLLSGAVLAGLVVLCLHGMVDDAFYSIRGTPLLLFLPGIAVALARPIGETEYKSGRIISFNGKLEAGLKGKKVRAILAAGILIAIGLWLVLWKPVRASWYANYGAVLMAQAELAHFPANYWDDGSRQLIVKSTAVQTAVLSFNRSLQLDPTNQTSLYRMGLIQVARGEIGAAVEYLRSAHQSAPEHRGIRKVLGYVHAWAGDFSRALPLLRQLPEAQDEMSVYAWWWRAHGQEDLAERSAKMADLLADKKNLTGH